MANVLKIKIITLSTNPDILPCKKIVDIYLSEFNKEIKFNKIFSKTLMDFYIGIKQKCFHLITYSIDINNDMITIDNKDLDLFQLSDIFFVYISLEKEETLKKLSNLIKILKREVDNEKKIYIIGCYNKKENILEQLYSENINKFLNEQEFYYEYSISDLNDKKEIANKINQFIYEEIFENQTDNLIANKFDDNTNEKDNDESHSLCRIE